MEIQTRMVRLKNKVNKDADLVKFVKSDHEIEVVKCVILQLSQKSSFENSKINSRVSVKIV